MNDDVRLRARPKPDRLHKRHRSRLHNLLLAWPRLYSESLASPPREPLSHFFDWHRAERKRIYRTSFSAVNVLSSKDAPMIYDDNDEVMNMIALASRC